MDRLPARAASPCVGDTPCRELHRSAFERDLGDLDVQAWSGRLHRHSTGGESLRRCDVVADDDRQILDPFRGRTAHENIPGKGRALQQFNGINHIDRIAWAVPAR